MHCCTNGLWLIQDSHKRTVAAARIREIDSRIVCVQFVILAVGDYSNCVFTRLKIHGAAEVECGGNRIVVDSRSSRVDRRRQQGNCGERERYRWRRIAVYRWAQLHGDRKSAVLRREIQVYALGKHAFGIRLLVHNKGLAQRINPTVVLQCFLNIVV